jgi:hypothetical protein
MVPSTKLLLVTRILLLLQAIFATLYSSLVQRFAGVITSSHSAQRPSYQTHMTLTSAAEIRIKLREALFSQQRARKVSRSRYYTMRTM